MINNYNRLPIGKYIDICAIYADTSLDDLTKQVKTLSILTDKTEDDILDLPILEYQGMAKEAKFLEASFSIPKDAGRIGRTYNLGKWKLKPVSEIGKMSTAQYVDFQHLCDDPLHHLPELVSVFLIPEGHKYNTGYDIIELQDDIRNTLCVADASSLLAFFLRKFNASIKGILLYSKLQVRMMRDKSKREEMMVRIRQAEMSLAESGDGLQMLMELPRPADVVGM